MIISGTKMAHIPNLEDNKNFSHKRDSITFMCLQHHHKFIKRSESTVILLFVSCAFKQCYGRTEGWTEQVQSIGLSGRAMVQRYLYIEV